MSCDGSLSVVETTINKYLEQIDNWLAQNRISLNTDKS